MNAGAPAPVETESAAPGSGRHRLLSIDVLRGVAVLLVVLSHVPFSWARSLGEDAESAFPSALHFALNMGASGVHLFLVISGFCIHMPWAREGERDRTLEFGRFWLRRMRRLYPPYFVALTLSIGVMVCWKLLQGPASGLLESFGYATIGAVVLDAVLLLFLLHNLTGAAWKTGNGPLWTLALEEQLYMLYFPLLWLRRRLDWPRALALVFVLTMAWRAWGQFVTPSLTALGFWYVVGPSRWFDWALGAVAVEAHLGMIKLPRWTRSLPLGLLILAAAIALTAAARSPGSELVSLHIVVGDAVFALAYFLIVNHLTERERGGRVPRAAVVRTLAWVGTISYSIYLVHAPLMAAAQRIAFPTHSLVAVTLAKLIVGTFGGYMFFRFVERRFLNTRS